MKKAIKSLLIAAVLVTAVAAGETENFGGIGVSVWAGASGIKVAGVIPNSPAESIGLQAGDLIVSANGTELSAVEPSQQINYLRGEAGSAVSLVVERGGEKIALSAKRAGLSVQSLDAQEISAWYGKSEGLTAGEISFLASQKTCEGCELLAVMQHGMPIPNSADGISINSIQQISAKKADEKQPEINPAKSSPGIAIGETKDCCSLANAKGAKAKKQGKTPAYRILK